MIYFLSKKKSLFKLSSKIAELTSISEIINAVKDEKVLALDTETTGLSYNDRVIMLQLGTLGLDQYIIDVRDIPIEALHPILLNKVIVGHNIKFDYNMLKKHGILLNNVYDTMLAEKVIYNGEMDFKETIDSRRFSLAGVYYKYFKKRIDKEIREEFLKIGDKPFSLANILYGANDVLYPLKIKEKQEPLIEERLLGKCVSLENKVTLALADIEYNGIKLNKDSWLKISETYKAKSKETEKILDSMIINSNNEKARKYVLNAVQLDLFTNKPSNEKSTTINWNSDKQVYEILTEVFGIYPVDKHGKPSSSAKAIELLTEKHDITELILRFREEQKVVNSFGESFLNKFLAEDGRIHTTYNQIIETGRVSSRNPNMQQIPKEEIFRKAFEAEEGRVLITADYSSQEARIMADKANDSSYIEFFKTGDGDIHSFVATKMFSAAFGREFIVTKTNENKEYRQQGKILNFFISFGGSAFTLSKTLKISMQEAEVLINSFYKGFPALKDLFDNCKRFALENGYIRTNSITNRIRYFPTWKIYKRLSDKGFYNLTDKERKELYSIKGAIERRAQNTPIQGTAGDITKTALVILRNNILKENINPADPNSKVKVVNVVHDEIVIECLEEEKEKWQRILEDSMKEAGRIFLKHLTLEVESGVYKHWKH